MEGASLWDAFALANCVTAVSITVQDGNRAGASCRCGAHGVQAIAELGNPSPNRFSSSRHTGSRRALASCRDRAAGIGDQPARQPSQNVGRNSTKM